jgi:hypothetical protein
VEYLVLSAEPKKPKYAYVERNGVTMEVPLYWQCRV